MELTGHTAVVFGLANKRSIAWAIAQKLAEAGATLAICYQNERLRVLNETPEKPGASVILTLDLDLQYAAEQALGTHSGAVVVLDTRTGEILAMVSHPSFDPNRFASGLTAVDWRRLTGDPPCWRSRNS